jgi:hypothetical protein
MPLLAVWGVSAEMPADYKGRPFDDAAYRKEQREAAERPVLPYHHFEEAEVVWRGTTSRYAGSWVISSQSNASSEVDVTDGKSIIHFHAKSPAYQYVGFGSRWAGPEEKAVKLDPSGALSFSIKVTGTPKMQELFFGLDYRDSTHISLRPYQPSFADGGWHRVTIPVRAFAKTPAASALEMRTLYLSTFVWNAADFDVFVEDITFDREVESHDTAAPPVRSGKGSSSRGQTIPGRVECAFYDLGGEGVAYHDTTPINILSSVLNQQAIHQRPHATAYHWNFRREEGVDISFAKDFADLNHPNPTDPPVNQLYIGGTEDDEWCNYTVRVKKAGTYQIVAAYGNIAGMKPLHFLIDRKPAAECACPVVTGSMHRWTREKIGTITFPEAGTHLLTLQYERGYNLGYFDFEPVK